MTTAQNLYETKGVYGNQAKYDAANDRFTQMISIIATLPSPKKMLDVGCGTGYFSSMLQKKYINAKFSGFDVSHIAIKEGKKLYPKIDLRVVNAEEKFPYATNKFDLVVSGEHIAHLKEVDTYVSEMYRVTAPKGYLLITTPNLASWLNRALLLFGNTPFFMEPSFQQTMPSIRILGKTFPDPSMPPSGHLRLYSAPMLSFLLSLHGWSTVKTWGVSSLTHPIVKGVDRLFTRIPNLASGVIILAQKNI